MQRAGLLKRLLGTMAANGPWILEHIVVDGEDGAESRALAADYPNVSVIPGPDRNSHHAINKGIAAARGEIIGFVNTDDRIRPGALAAVQAYFERHPDCVMLRTACHLAPLDAPPGHEPLELHHLGDEAGLLAVLLFGTPGFNAWFFRRDFLLRHGSLPDTGAAPGAGGVLDERYVIAADRDLLLRLYFAGFRPDYLPVPVYVYGLHEASATLNNAGRGVEQQLAEHIKIAERLRPAASAATGVAAAMLDAWAAFEIWVLVRVQWREGRRAAALALLGRAWAAAPDLPFRLWRARAQRAALIAQVKRERGEAC